MYDVNPLGPIMHLKQIERDALALRAAAASERSPSRNAASAWITGVLKRLGTWLRDDVSAGSRVNVGRR